ncbi:MAG: DUF5686 and carboxypeptidase regulatory-like domain-containing protein [Saprospiraceae bacterium]
MNLTRHLFSTLFFVLSTIVLYAGGINGTITDTNGQPIPYATIYVKELGTGTTSNSEGNYVYRLAAGVYNVTFQTIGYETVVKRINVSNAFVTTNIILKEQTYELAQVEVTSGGRDPAYTIMRKAIAKAKFHTNQLDGYTTQVYIKGSGRLIDSPFFLRKMIAKEGVDSTFAFTSESVNQVTYTRPNKYEEKVISVYTTGNADNDNVDPNGFINASFYESDIAGSISPLSPKAFAYYKFVYEGFFVDRGKEIDKIRVIPRSKGDNVFSGTLNLIDGEWAIHSLDLSTYVTGVKINTKQVYAPIEEKAWLPISLQIKVTGKYFGFKFEGNYLASLSDYKITINPDLEYEVEVIDEAVEKELAKQIEESRNAKVENIEGRLSEGKEVTRKELKKMLKEYEKEEKKEQAEPEVTSTYNFEIDSMATKRDSLYWENIRPIPLTKLEVKGYVVVDSMIIADKEEAKKDSLGVRKNKKKEGFGVGDLLFGGSYGKTKEKRFFIKPALNTVQFNTVEGYNFEYGLRYRQDYKNNTRWFLEGTARYGFARKKLNYRFDTGLDFNRKSATATTVTMGSNGTSVTSNGHKGKGQIRLSGGKYIFQYNPDNPIHPLINTLTSLVSENNFMKLYEKQFVKLAYQQQINRKWQIKAAAEWSDRNTLQNNSSHVYFDKDSRSYTPNIPNNVETSTDFVPHQALIGSFGIKGRPWQKYRIRSCKTYAINNSSPTLSLNLRQNFHSDSPSINNNFTHVELGFQHEFKVGYRGKMDVKVNAGTFFNQDNMQFPDYKHFLGNQTIFSTTDPVGSFRLLDYYTYSTNDAYLNAHVHYQFRKFLVSQIFEVQMLGIKENIFVNYLNTDFSQNYFEVGYGIDNIARIFRLEFISSFQDAKYLDFGIRIGIATNLDNLFN